MLIGLCGELGAGKTEFVRGFVSGLLPEGEVTSPSYVLENIYTLDNPVRNVEEIHHWDLYRLGEGANATELLEIRQHPHAMAIVEWVNYSNELRNLLTIEILITSSGFEGAAMGGGEETQMRTIEFQVFRDEALFKELQGVVER